MAFLKKHYEKILLAAFLVIFVIALLYQIEIITSDTKVTAKDLQLKAMTENYKSQQVDFSSEQFKVNHIFMQGSSWSRSIARNKADKYFTDLLIPFPMVRCPHPDCQKIIPNWLLFHAPHECPFCHGELKTPEKGHGPPVIIITGTVTATTDSDNGGVPDLVEKKFGLNPALVSDDTEDLDGDGFANSYEYQAKTKMNDAKSHPPLYLRLRLDKLVKNKLDFTLKNIIVHGKDKADWDIQINFGNNKTDFFWLGDMMKVGSRRYKIIAVNAKKIKVQNGNIEEFETAGNIKIKSADGKEEITAVIGKDVFSPNPRAVIIDESTGRKYSMNIGDVIEIGSKKTGVSRYQVTNINSAKGKEAVTVQDMANKKTYTIDFTLKIPKLLKSQSMDNEAGALDGIPGEMMPPAEGKMRNGRPNNRRPNNRRPNNRRPNIPNF